MTANIATSSRTCLMTAALCGLLAGVPVALAQDADTAERAEPRTAAPVASHRGYRATHLFDAIVHDRHNRALGSVEDLVIDSCSGELRHAVLVLGEGLLPGGGRRVAVPAGSLEGPVVGAIESPVDRLVLDIDGRALAILPAAADPAPAPITPGLCERELSARWLVGRDLFGRNGQDIGKIADLVISMNRARVNFAVLKFDPDWGPPDRLLAFPVQLFRIASEGRLVFPVGEQALRELPGFIASGWPHVLSPDELADVDRQFIADFPGIWDQSPRTLFEHLDADQSGALSRSEALASERLHGRRFAQIDSDGDRRLSKVEFVRNFPSLPATPVSAR